MSYFRNKQYQFDSERDALSAVRWAMLAAVFAITAFVLEVVAVYKMLHHDRASGHYFLLFFLAFCLALLARHNAQSFIREDDDVL